MVNICFSSRDIGFYVETWKSNLPKKSQDDVAVSAANGVAVQGSITASVAFVASLSVLAGFFLAGTGILVYCRSKRLFKGVEEVDTNEQHSIGSSNENIEKIPVLSNGDNTEFEVVNGKV